jgi:hypothetical protein
MVTHGSYGYAWAPVLADGLMFLLSARCDGNTGVVRGHGAFRDMEVTAHRHHLERAVEDEGPHAHQAAGDLHRGWQVAGRSGPGVQDDGLKGRCRVGFCTGCLCSRMAWGGVV